MVGRNINCLGFLRVCVCVRVRVQNPDSSTHIRTSACNIICVLHVLDACTYQGITGLVPTGNAIMVLGTSSGGELGSCVRL